MLAAVIVVYEDIKFCAAGADLPANTNEGASLDIVQVTQ